MRWRITTLALALSLSLSPHALVTDASSAQTACTLQAHPLQHFSHRVDTLLAARASGTAFALMGSPAASVRFLPHDNVQLVDLADGRSRGPGVLVLPPYIAPPSLVAGADGKTAFLLVDSTLSVLDIATGTPIARYTLDMQAVGWPAAIAAAPGHSLYIAGQPTGAWTAQIEALTLTPPASPRMLWRAPLGLTHAGIWLGLTGSHYLATYLPDAHDVTGTIALLDPRTGSLVRSYNLPTAPIAADPLHDRLYLVDAGTIRAFALSDGEPIATTSGMGPLAVDPAHSLVAFARSGGIVQLADARTLHPLAQLGLPGITALAFTLDGKALLVGMQGGITRIDVGHCDAQMRG
jgi:hypothetical protein